MAGIFQTLVASSFCWFLASSLWVYPHSLSYFNELIGGPSRGSDHLLGSSLHWGQDLRYLKWSLQDHSVVGPIYLADFGYLDPADLGIDCLAPQLSATDGRTFQKLLLPGWHAISVSFLRGFPRKVHDGAGNLTVYDPYAPNTYREIQPVAQAGYSILIYDVR